VNDSCLKVNSPRATVNANSRQADAVEAAGKALNLIPPGGLSIRQPENSGDAAPVAFKNFIRNFSPLN
jgi:hypothetical protein